MNDIDLLVGGNFTPFMKDGEVAVTSLQRKIAEFSKGMSQLGGGGSGLGKLTYGVNEFDRSLAAASKRVLAFGASLAVFGAVSKALHDLVTDSISVQKAMIDINSTMQTTSANLNKVMNGIFDIARATGTTFAVAAEGAKDLAQQGLGAEETLNRLKAALILTRISGQDVHEVITDLTATLSNFSKEGLTAMDVTNRLAAVSSSFAVSAKDINEALKSVGSTAQDAGVNFNQLVALITSLKQVTGRDAGTIGSALNAIFTREQRGGMVDELKQLNIQISQSANGIQILQAIADQYNKLGNNQAAKGKLESLLGGIYQGNQLKAVLSDISSQYGYYNAALNKVNNSTDDAIKRNDALNQSFEALKTSVGDSFTQLFSKVGSTAVLQPLTSLFKDINEALQDLNKVADTSGVQGFLRGIANILSGPGLITGMRVLINLFAQSGDLVKNIFTQFVVGNTELKRQQVSQAAIVELLKNASAERLKELDAATTLEGKEAVLLKIYQDQNAALAERSSFMAAAASSSIGVTLRQALPPRYSADMSGIGGAVAREKDALIQRGYSPNFASNAIFVGSDPRVGIGIGNLIDEPSGTISQGVNRAISEGKNPRTYGVPNFALGPKSLQNANNLRQEWDDLVQRGLGGTYLEYIIDKAKKVAAPLKPSDKQLFFQKIFPGNLRDDIYAGVENAEALRLRESNPTFKTQFGEPYFGPIISKPIIGTPLLTVENMSSAELPNISSIKFFSSENQSASPEVLAGLENRIAVGQRGISNSGLPPISDFENNYMYSAKVGQRGNQTINIEDKIASIKQQQDLEKALNNLQRGKLTLSNIEDLTYHAQQQYIQKNFKGLSNEQINDNPEAVRLIKSFVSSQKDSILEQALNNNLSNVKQQIYTDYAEAKGTTSIFGQRGLAKRTAAKLKEAGFNEEAGNLLARSEAEVSQRVQMGGIAGSFGLSMLAGFAGNGVAGSALQGAASGLAIGSFFPGIGTAIGGIGGGLLGGGISLLEGHNKSSDELTQKLQELTGKFTDSANAANTYLQTQSKLNDLLESGSYNLGQVSVLMKQMADSFKNIDSTELKNAFLANINNPEKLPEILAQFQQKSSSIEALSSLPALAAKFREGTIPGKLNLSSGNIDQPGNLQLIAQTIANNSNFTDNKGNLNASFSQFAKLSKSLDEDDLKKALSLTGATQDSIDDFVAQFNDDMGGLSTALQEATDKIKDNAQFEKATATAVQLQTFIGNFDTTLKNIASFTDIISKVNLNTISSQIQVGLSGGKSVLELMDRFNIGSPSSRINTAFNLQQQDISAQYGLGLSSKEGETRTAIRNKLQNINIPSELKQNIYATDFNIDDTVRQLASSKALSPDNLTDINSVYSAFLNEKNTLATTARLQNYENAKNQAQAQATLQVNNFNALSKIAQNPKSSANILSLISQVTQGVQQVRFGAIPGRKLFNPQKENERELSYQLQEGAGVIQKYDQLISMGLSPEQAQQQTGLSQAMVDNFKANQINQLLNQNRSPQAIISQIRQGIALTPNTTHTTALNVISDIQKSINPSMSEKEKRDEVQKVLNKYVGQGSSQEQSLIGGLAGRFSTVVKTPEQTTAEFAAAVKEFGDFTKQLIGLGGQTTNSQIGSFQNSLIQSLPSQSLNNKVNSEKALLSYITQQKSQTITKLQGVQNIQDVLMGQGNYNPINFSSVSGSTVNEANKLFPQTFSVLGDKLGENILGNIKSNQAKGNFQGQSINDIAKYEFNYFQDKIIGNGIKPEDAQEKIRQLLLETNKNTANYSAPLSGQIDALNKQIESLTAQIEKVTNQIASDTNTSTTINSKVNVVVTPNAQDLQQAIMAFITKWFSDNKNIPGQQIKTPPPSTNNYSTAVAG